MSDSNLQQNREILENAQAKGLLATFFAFFRLSGPGWMQSAITLGGGSLAGALFLGILGGANMLWLQLVAIAIGVIMLSAISYVTLSTGKRPYAAINEYVNPVLGVGWVVATILANMIWIMPQFGLCFSSLETAQLAGLNNVEDTLQAKQIVSGVIAGLATVIVIMSFWPGIMSKIIDWILKIMVGFVVICFVAVVILLFREGAFDFKEVLMGFVPNLMHWNTVSPDLQASMVDLGPEVKQFWSERIIDRQRSSMIGVTATAVGLNMTFLLPYSMLARGWGRSFRGLAKFDLITALAIPFIIVTSCIVLASAHAFHAKADPAFLSNDPNTVASSKFYGGSKAVFMDRLQTEMLLEEKNKFESIKETEKKFVLLQDFAATRYKETDENQNSEGGQPDEDIVKNDYLLAQRDKAFAAWNEKSDEEKADELAVFAASIPPEERKLAATLVKPNVGQLAVALEPLLGEKNANLVFGLGALAMGFSTIIILMIINGYAFAEITGRYNDNIVRSIGAIAAVAVGFFWYEFWDGESKTWLGIIASTFGAILLPIAYIAFFALMNSRRLLGDDKPRGIRWFIWNILMLIGVVGALIQAVAAVNIQLGKPDVRPYMIAALVTFLTLALIGFSARSRPSRQLEST